MKMIDAHFETYKQYFEQFVNAPIPTGISLKSYYCDLIETVIAASRSEDSFGYPLLHLELPQVRFEERSEMLMVHFDSTGVILVHADEDSPVAKNAALKNARQIWDLIFSTLKKSLFIKTS